jgi:hypothetical protein
MVLKNTNSDKLSHRFFDANEDACKTDTIRSKESEKNFKQSFFIIIQNGFKKQNTAAA